MGLAPKAQATKAKISQSDDLTLKSFCTAKETASQIKRKPVKWEHTFANHLSKMYQDGGGEYPKYIGNPYNLIAIHQTPQLKMSRGPEQSFFRRCRNDPRVK